MIQKKRNQNSLKKIDIQFKDETYVDEAEKVIKEIKKCKYKKEDEVTTSKLRTLLALTSEIYDELRANGMADVTDKISYLQIQFVYQGGRYKGMKDFIEEAQLIEILKGIQRSKEPKEFIRFNHYMEALVAYFKYYIEEN